MQITVKIKLLPNREQARTINKTMNEYIRAVNTTVTEYMVAGKNLRYTSKDIGGELPSALKAQITQDAKSIYQKYRKTGKQSILKKPVAIWNNQNYSIKEGILSFPVWKDGKSTRIHVKGILTPYQSNLLTDKLGTLRITNKSGKYIAQIAVNCSEQLAVSSQTMGVDLGLKVPAVAVTETGKTKFFGNGRQNKYIKRKHRSIRRKLGKLKKLEAISKQQDKEQRWMKDQDHKISRGIVNFAVENSIGVIRLEKLANIRQTARTSRKNEKNLHTWSFYRLAQYIEYKAKLAGIVVEYVNPKYTSQKCPVCGRVNKAKDRKYQCSCGFKTHRDRLGAINIITAPVTDGNSLSA